MPSFFSPFEFKMAQCPITQMGHACEKDLKHLILLQLLLTYRKLKCNSVPHISMSRAPPSSLTPSVF